MVIPIKINKKIMAKFKPKKIIRDVKEFYKNNPTAKITTATAGFSGTNLAINATRKNSDKKYQEEQLEAMDKLTKALGGVNKTLKEVEVKEPKSKFPDCPFFGHWAILPCLRFRVLPASSVRR